MNIKQIITVGIAGMAMGVMALDSVEVTEVKARQRYPWNGIVDIDFKLDSIPTEPYRMKVEVYDNVGKTNLTVKSAWTEGVSYKDNPCMVRTDTRRILWDSAADLPNGFKCTNVLVTCRDERLEDDPKRYMIIDLSAGSTATTYPVSYTNCPPPGGWTEEYKTTKLVLRKIKPSRFVMGSPITDTERKANEAYHEVSLTHSYYIGVFKVTSAQYAMICGGTYSDVKNMEATLAVWRGWDMVNTEKLTSKTYSGGGIEHGIDGQIKFTQNCTSSSYCWPTSSAVDPESFIGKLRSRTKLTLDMPTEAQWECACRGNSSTPLYIGDANSDANAQLIRGNNYVSSQDGLRKIYVGNYLPNANGLFDMNNHFGEWCLDVYLDNLGTSPLIDPQGATLKYEKVSLTMNLTATVERNILYYDGVYYYDGTVPGLYVGYGIRRVIKGVSARSAERSSALTLNNTGNSFTGYKVMSAKLKASYTNPTYGLRLALTVDE